MGSLQRHQRTLISHLNKAFQELAEEADQHNIRIQTIEKENRSLQQQLKNDEKRIQDLRSEIAQLQNPEKVTVEEAEDEKFDLKLQLLERTYEPESIFNDARRKSNTEQTIQYIKSNYQSLYNEAVTLTKVSIALRNQVKRHKARIAKWKSCSGGQHRSNPSPEIKNLGVAAAEGVPQNDGIHDDIQTPVASTPPLVQLRDLMHSTTKHSEPGSTASNLASTASVSSCNEETELRPKFEGSDCGTVLIKEEPLSSPRSLPEPVIQPSGSQDLDEVGNVVTTPRSRKFAVFEDDEQVNINNRKGEHHILQPKDTNQINMYPKSRESSFKRRRIGDSGASAISSVSEDGDEAYKRFLRNGRPYGMETPCKGSIRNPEVHRRLFDLLSARPHKHSPALDLSLARTPARTPLANGRQTTQGVVEDLMNNKTGRSSVKRRPFHEPNTENVEDWNAIMRSVPYREQPIDCLDLSCFKPNPARNQGLDYAFNDVVRNREQRKCLPGCMRADCCGEKFRAMVRAGGSIYEEAKHRDLLENFLGDQSHTLETLTEDERNKLLVEAKARQLANQFGKHRHTYDRPRSPPGFWRTDMPSTQELAKDRQEADRLERDKVLDRVREALRPDGLWKFADEA